jgi:hypothetical protein
MRAAHFNRTTLPHTQIDISRRLETAAPIFAVDFEGLEQVQRRPSQASKAQTSSVSPAAGVEHLGEALAVCPCAWRGVLEDHLGARAFNAASV